MKDLTAILVHYSDQAILHKALFSLKKLDSSLESVMVFQEQNMSLNMDHGCDWFDKIQFIPIAHNDLGEMLNNIIYKLTTPYVLILHDTDYLSPAISIESLKLFHSEIILGILYRNRNTIIHHPLLIRTSFLKKEKFLSNHQLPFKEAFFPAWLSTKEISPKLFKEGLVKQGRKNNSANIKEKQKFIQKYQLKKVKTEHPTISVLMSNYNMGKYVETAVASCLLQNERIEQILIMDDGSTDNSHKLLQRWADGKQVKVFNKKNGGKAKALNDVLSHVKTDFILELDADDWLDPDAVFVIKKHLSDLPKDIAVLYGNLRKWKQVEGDVLFKGVTQGVAINGKAELLSYRFPLGPRIYRTSFLKEEGGFPVVEFENGRLYEDVSVLNRLIKNFRFCYHDFTVYNVREHNESITKNNDSKWNDFLETLNPN
ncbi:glycosyl transferase family 2 [Virgibacillus necropolis]|uniref:Glycosyl transferase family 2 n=1 Tax=Virgibacillus necropolis TaxID=163877 RepID=A0A221MI46_9BACI|nr:glycosyl transferase family 2 [Virgibacillus necropolis]